MTPVQEPEVPIGFEDVPHSMTRLTPRRRAIARNMETAAAVPTLTADVQVDLTKMLEVRSTWDKDRRPSVMACIAKACVDALEEFPNLNATYTERYLVQWETINLSIAVDTAGGLLTPVVRDAQLLSAEELTTAIADQAERARQGELTPKQFAGATFTLSNPGSIGPSLRAEALLNPPQVALLGLPGLQRRPIVVGSRGDERVEIRSILEPSLTFDHRALDGGAAVLYLTAVRDRLQGWEESDYQRTNGVSQLRPTT